MKTSEGTDRIDKDEEMRQDKRARVEMDASDSHEKPAEARHEDVQMGEERGDRRTAQNADSSNSGKVLETSGAAEKGTNQHSASSSSTSQATSSNDT